jgi:hypothetical protein
MTLLKVLCHIRGGKQSQTEHCFEHTFTGTGTLSLNQRRVNNVIDDVSTTSVHISGRRNSESFRVQTPKFAI